MHELSIAYDIISTVESRLVEYPGATVNSVTVLIGRYSGVDPEALSFCFPLAAENTKLSTAQLSLSIEPLTLECNECQSGAHVSRSLQCPSCGSLNITVIAGRNMKISSVDISLPEESAHKYSTVAKK